MNIPNLDMASIRPPRQRGVDVSLEARSHDDRWRVIACALILHSLLAGSVDAEPPLSLSTVLDAWEKRQEQTRSLEADWTQEQVLLKGSVPRPPAGEFPQPPHDAVIPPEDVTLQGTYRLLIDDSKMLYLEDNDLWSPNNNSMYRQRFTVAFADKVSKAFFPTSTSPYPIGEIEPEQPPLGLTNHRNIRPLRMIFRPIDPHWRGFPKDRLLLRPYDAVSDGRQTPIVAYVENSHVSTDVWVDPDRGFLPLKHIVTVDGEITNTLEIRYREDPQHGWLPASWEWSEMSDGALSLSYRATVTQLSLNQGIPASAFDITFDPGTWVFDKLDGSEYVIREDGSRRYVAKGEGAADYDRLLHGEPLARGLLVGSIIVAAIMVLVVLDRRNRGSRKA